MRKKTLMTEGSRRERERERENGQERLTNKEKRIKVRKENSEDEEVG